MPATRVITSCTNRKRRAGKPLSLTRTNFPTLAEAVAYWSAQVARQTDRRPVKDLYVGRSFSDAACVAAQLSAQLSVVSAGLGLVDSEELVPAYNLTVSAGPGSIRSMLVKLDRAPSHWWDALASTSHSNTVSRVLNDRATGIALIALPSTYLEMVVDDLNQILDESLTKLRIFTSGPGVRSLPTRLRPYVLPYDKRLEATTHAGTQADFPQRAMRHFVQTLNATNLPIEAAHRAVENSLIGVKVKTMPLRARVSDEAVTRLIRKNWDKYQGNSARLLRFLRDDALVACEQSRFRSLWHSVRAEVEA